MASKKIQVFIIFVCHGNNLAYPFPSRHQTQSQSLLLSNQQSEFANLKKILEKAECTFTYFHHVFKGLNVFESGSSKFPGTHHSTILNLNRHYLTTLKNHFPIFTQLTSNKDFNTTFITRPRFSFFKLGLSPCKIHMTLDLTPLVGLWSTRVESYSASFLLLLSFPWSPVDFSIHQNILIPELSTMPGIPLNIGFPRLIIFKVTQFQKLNLLYHSRGFMETEWGLRILSKAAFPERLLKDSANMENPLPKIYSLWISLHQDMWGTPIGFGNPTGPQNRIVADPSIKNPAEACDPFFNTGSEMWSQLCSILLLQKSLNFSLVRETTGRIVNVYTAVTFQTGMMEPSWRCLAHVPKINSNGFVVIHKDARTQEIHSQIKGLVRPFKPSLLAAFLGFGIASAIIFAQGDNKPNGKTGILKNWIHLTALLIYQSVNMKWNRGPHCILIFLYGTWAFGILTISEMYRGELFTSLS